MNRLPTKQIYLLFIIIVGIIALSVYSTYALFTFENSIEDIVAIHIPKSLTISENIYEYQQITVPSNTIATTDIDIQNTFDYEVCYSVWYKVLGEEDIKSKVQVFEKNSDTLTSSGLLAAMTNKRVTLIIINDNESDILINLGTIGTKKEDGSCSLNIASDKNVVSTSYKQIEVLSSKLIEETKPNNIKENYITYKDIKEKFTYKDTDKIYASNTFTYSKEIFTLTDSEYITFEELVNKNSLSEKDIYFCKDKEQCSILYTFKITDVTKNEKEIDLTEDEKIIEISYDINRYDKLIGYSEGENGLRKINEKDYMYYGDNPNNYIYYNCEDPDNQNTCELWRILGFFYDEKEEKYLTKIVRNESIGAYQFDYKMEEDKNNSSNIWNTSILYKYLTEEYKMLNSYETFINEYEENVERIPDLEIDVKNLKIKDEKNKTKISILSLSDYLNTSICNKTKISEYKDECLTNNWLNNIEIPKEWTITSKEVEIVKESEEIIEPEEDTNNEENNEIINEEESIEKEESTEPVDDNVYVINYVYTIGKNIEANDVNESYAVRPVVYLKSRILLLGGNGTFETPYIVK